MMLARVAFAPGTSHSTRTEFRHGLTGRMDVCLYFITIIGEKSRLSQQKKTPGKKAFEV